MIWLALVCVLVMVGAAVAVEQHDLQPVVLDFWAASRGRDFEEKYRDQVVSSYAFYGYWDWRFCSLLLISTLKAIFEGRRELFDGLAIDQQDAYE